MTIYKNHEQKELPVYGLSGLEVYYKNTGNTYYQLTEHLGSVRAVIIKNGTKAAALVAAHDYYSFGMPMPGRTLSDAEGYRYAYEGQEKDPETGKEAFQLRLWDDSIGRWLTTAPYGQYSSPYIGMGNNPITRVDPDGGYDKWWKAFKAWVGGGFQGKISKVDNPGTPLHKYSIKKWDDENNMWSVKLGDLSALKNSGYYADNGAYIKSPTGTIGEYKPNWAMNLSEGNMAEKFTYNTLNGFFTTGQFFMGISVRDNSMRNLNRTSTTSKEGLENFIDVGGGAVVGQVTKGARILKPIVSDPTLWNTFQKSTKGLYSTSIKSQLYKSHIYNLNNDIVRHNIGAQSAIHGRIATWWSGKAISNQNLAE